MKVITLFLAAAGISCAALADETIWDDRPGSMDRWEETCYPVGNGRIGAMLDGGAVAETVQFNVDTLWTGGEVVSGAVTDRDSASTDNPRGQFGCYKNFGRVIVSLKDAKLGGLLSTTGYRRQIDLATGVYSVEFKIGEKKFRREVIASIPDDLIGMRFSAEGEASPGGCPFDVKLVLDVAGADANTFSGTLPNGLGYAAKIDTVQDGDGAVIVWLRAKTTYDAKAKDGKFGCNGKPAVIVGTCPKDWASFKSRAIAAYKELYNRVTLEVKCDQKSSSPTRVRLEAVQKGTPDPALEVLQFKFGRYILIASSKPGTLPANLQGLWNCKEFPPWNCDFHSNINIQMNYWGADVANLSELFDPLSDYYMSIIPRVTAETKRAFPSSDGFAFRTAMNAYGGMGWNWNFAGAPWIACQMYDHYLFTLDRKYLQHTVWPFMKGSAEFIFTHLKKRDDGTVVVANGWSPEHGPREDGVAHDQQIVKELFRDILAAAKTLGIKDAFTKKVAELDKHLLGNKIGKWGQLQEWETDRDKKGDDHRHTSHLFAVYPGTTISRSATPEFAKAAQVALEGRALTGDARRSWTWPWRTALWARLGNGEKAGEMITNLQRYNTREQLLTTHRPFQIDGNLGLVGAVPECLVQSHETTADGKVLIRILPALPSGWKSGMVKGLKARGGYTVDILWKDGKLVKYAVKGGKPNNYQVVK